MANDEKYDLCWCEDCVVSVLMTVLWFVGVDCNNFDDDETNAAVVEVLDIEFLSNDGSSCDGLRCLLLLDDLPPTVDADIAADDLIRNAILLLLLPLTLPIYTVIISTAATINLYQLDDTNEKNDGTRRLCICFYVL